MNAIQNIEIRIWQKQALQRSVYSSFILWSQSYPSWEDALFEKAFVQREVMPILNRMVNGEPGVGTAKLVQVWMEQLRLHYPHRQVWSSELLPAAYDFLHIFQGEFEYECKRRQRSFWYKVCYGMEPDMPQPATMAS